MGENFFLNNKRLYPILELYNTQEEFKSKQTSKSRHIIASVHIENEQYRGNTDRKKATVHTKNRDVDKRRLLIKNHASPKTVE